MEYSIFYIHVEPYIVGKLGYISQLFGGLAPFRLDSVFFQNVFFGKKEMPTKNGEHHMKEQNKSFQIVYGFPK
jgi:hypothetical protein